jgi:GDP-mannose 6-dehydrogenase
MKVSIFGLGYVGVVTAACLTKADCDVWGVDVNDDKVGMMNAGQCPIIEPGLDDLIKEGHQRGKLHATTDATEAVLTTDVSLVCVGTPSKRNGSLDLHGVEIVAQEIGEALRQKKGHHCVILRSTVMPGTTRNLLIPTLEAASQKKVHKDFDVCFNPEFLREGSSIKDFYKPPFTVIGQETSRGGDAVVALYKGVDGPQERTTYEVSEMLKYACNAYHAIKVTFANEIGVICKSMGIDSHRVMELFALDKKLNISSAYLKPGFAFGGSCLPKDLRALMYKAKEQDIDIPVLGSAMESNRLHIQRVVDQIANMKRKKLGFLGLSFKAGTDDLRESPIVPVIESLIGKGFKVKIYDADVHLASIFGANKKYIEHEIPHISTLMSTKIDEVIRESDVIVVSKPENEYKEALVPYLGKKTIIDLVRIPFNIDTKPEHYDGICW